MSSEDKEYVVGFEIDLGKFEETNTPIEDNGIYLIVGREEDCKVLMVFAEKSGGTQFLITGAWGVGKTTMLRWAEKKAFNNFFKIELSNSLISSVEKFKWGLMKGFYANLQKYHLKPLFNSYMHKITYIVNKQFRKENEPIYESVLENLINFMETDEIIDKRRPIMVFIDDFNPTGEQRQIFREWLKTFMTNSEKRVYISVVMQDNILRRLKVEDPALLSRFSPQISLRLLTDEEIKELLRRRLLVARKNYDGKKGEWYPFTEKAIEKIAEESNGVPRRALYLTRIVLGYAIGSVKFPITVDFVSKVLRNKKLDTYSDLLNNVLGGLAPSILNLIEKKGKNGCMRITDIADELNIPKQRIYYWLKKLEEEGGYIDRKKRGFYCLKGEIKHAE